MQVLPVMSAALHVQVLGPLAVYRDGQEVRLPQSKKTRGLLGYLAITGRAHRRDRLCSLLWDVADDPRGALRWSLSKIRSLVDTEDARCLVADRESVELQLRDAYLDWRVARSELSSGLESISDQRLEELGAVFGGELLEGLDLTDFDEFTAWCAAEREHARTLHTKILGALVDRFQADPDTALPHARELVRIDPLNQEARAGLIRLLGSAGRRNEAQAQYESASRLLKELGAKPMGALVSAWREVNAHPSEATVPPTNGASTADAAPLVQEAEPARQDVLVGRTDERARLVSVLDTVAGDANLRVFLLKGESGVGKTRLLQELSHEARRRGSTVFEGAAYEAEARRPYGPWIDALRRLPGGVISSENSSALAPLLPELGGSGDKEHSRDRLFGAIVDLFAKQAKPNAPTLLLLDDIHWCDDATAELLHYVARMSRNQPVAIVLGARDGELVDNESAMRMLRSFRRDGMIDEHLLLPLTEQDIADLIEKMGSDADASRVFVQSGGNALLARELAQAASSLTGAVPRSLKELVSDRLDRLPPETGDVLRWGAVLGPSFDVERLTELISLDFDPLMNALSTLERHALLESDEATPGGYEFHHALVHRVVYSEISEPRRKLMHLRIAKLLEDRPDPDGDIGIEIAHHAGVGGDAAVAARACVAAGNRCLQMFAHSEAFGHARRGLRYAETLPDPERLKLKIELERVSMAAKIPENPEEEARRIEALAEHALDAGCAEHARLGFTVVSYLRWNVGAAGEAHRLSLRAEFASRGGDDKERIVGMAEAARCLVVLERDIAQGEALLLEARALAERSGESPWAVFDGVGLLRLHAGDLDEAKTAFEQAWATAKRAGDRLYEFLTLEHLVAVSMHQHDEDAACNYAKELAIIGEKLREGSERPLGRAMLALCRYRAEEVDHRTALEDGLRQLREADAKQRLSFVLTQTAIVEADRGELESAEARVEEALGLAEVLQQPSDIALARSVLLRIARERDDREAVQRHVKALGDIKRCAHHARVAVERELEAAGIDPDGHLQTQEAEL